jgi:hypothetical protein
MVPHAIWYRIFSPSRGKIAGTASDPSLLVCSYIRVHNHIHINA